MAEKVSKNVRPQSKSVSATRRQSIAKRHSRVRKTISGTAERPRLVVKRSARHTHVQLVDDTKSVTLAAASTMEGDVKSLRGDKKAKSAKVGELIAQRAKALGIESIVFDRGGYKYGGRIAALADAARDKGLSF